jgi:hypothetical protein
MASARILEDGSWNILIRSLLYIYQRSVLRFKQYIGLGNLGLKANFVFIKEH